MILPCYPMREARPPCHFRDADLSLGARYQPCRSNTLMCRAAGTSSPAAPRQSRGPGLCARDNTAGTSELARRAAGTRESLNSAYALEPNLGETSEFGSRAAHKSLNLVYAPLQVGGVSTLPILRGSRFRVSPRYITTQKVV
jgi:hypothetical protein